LQTSFNNKKNNHEATPSLPPDAVQPSATTERLSGGGEHFFAVAEMFFTAAEMFSTTAEMFSTAAEKFFTEMEREFNGVLINTLLTNK
jgi:hypothetical protein